jgi:hypothetical protein
MRIRIKIYSESDELIHKGNISTAGAYLAALLKKKTHDVTVDLIMLEEGVSFISHDNKRFKIVKEI